MVIADSGLRSELIESLQQLDSRLLSSLMDLFAQVRPLPCSQELVRESNGCCRKAGKRGTYVRTSSSQTRSLERGRPSPSAGTSGVPSHPGRRHSVEAVRGVPVGGAPGSSSWPALGARTLHGQGQSAPWRETDAAPPPRRPYLHGHFRSFLHRLWR